MRRLSISAFALCWAVPALALDPPPPVHPMFGIPGWVLPGASIDMDFANGRYWGKTPGQLTVSRASTESEVCNGVLYSFAANQPAITPCGLWVWEARTNGIRNSTMAGATVGVIGSGGALPTFWTIFAPGLTTQIVSTGSSFGMSYVDVRFSGTATNQFPAISFDATTATAALYGQTWTASAYVQVVDSTNVANLTVMGNTINWYNSVPSFISNAGAIGTPAALTTRTQLIKSATALNSATAWIIPTLTLSLTSSSVTLDVTIRIWQPQLELNPNIPASVASAIKAADGTGGVISASGVYTVTGGTCTTAPTLNVSWDAGGLMTVNSVAGAGSCTVLPPNPATLAYASGAATGWTGATVTLTPTDNSVKGFASGPILTSGSAATRALSIVTAVPPVQGAAYSMLCSMQPQAPTASNANQICSEYDNGGVAQRFFLVRQQSTGVVAGQLSSGQFVASAAALAQGSTGKAAASVSGLTLSETLNGAVPGTNAGASLPTAFSRLILGSNGGAVANAAITRMALWPNTALSSAQLQAVTK